MSASKIMQCGEMSTKYNLFPQRFRQAKVAKGSHYEVFHPLNNIDSQNNAPIHFLVRGTNDFINFDKCYFKMRGRFTGKKTVANGTDVAATDAAAEYGPVNNFANSLIKHIEISANGTGLSGASQTYPHHSYLHNTFNNTKNSLESTFWVAGWSKDDPDNMDAFKPTENKALAERRSRVNARGEVTFIFKPSCSLFQLQQLFPSKIDLSITLHKNPNRAFYMMYNTGDTYDFEITGVEVWIHKITVDPEYALAVEGTLNDGENIQYVLSDPRLDVHQIPSSISNFHKDHITFGHLPRRLLICFLDSTAYSGDSKKNPFNFKHFDIKKIGLTIDGIDFLRPPTVLDMANKNYTDIYYNMLQSFHATDSPFAMDIKEKDLEKGYFFISWEFSPDQMGGDIPENLVNQGTNIHLSVDFGAALNSAVTMLVYYELDMRVSINQYRQVMVETN